MPVTFIVPKTFAGLYFLDVSVDTANAIAELNESNNTNDLDFNFEVGPPDLTATLDASTLPALVSPGGQEHVTVTIGNNALFGLGPANGSIGLKLYASADGTSIAFETRNEEDEAVIERGWIS